MAQRWITPPRRVTIAVWGAEVGGCDGDDGGARKAVFRIIALNRVASATFRTVVEKRST